jgi:uncharacterized membrane protein HdeD (DUF308 family)
MITGSSITGSSAAKFATGTSFGGAWPSSIARNWRWMALRGVLALILGGVCFAFPTSALVAFTLVFSVYAGADGIVSVIAGIRAAAHGQRRWGAMILRGLFGIVVAVLFAIMPGAMTVGYAFAMLGLLAFWAIATGILELIAAQRIRHEHGGDWSLGIAGLVSLMLGGAVIGLIFTDPVASFVSSAWIVGIYAWVAGIALISLSLRLRRFAA